MLHGTGINIPEMNPAPTGVIPAAEPERRRRRPPVSCTVCRKRKIRCNRASPCNNCLRSKNSVCEYVTNSPSPRASRSQEAERSTGLSVDQQSTSTRESRVLSHSSSSIVPHSTNPSTPASQSSSREVEVLRSKIKLLEEQLAKAERASAASAQSPIWDSRGNQSHIAGIFHVHREAPSEGQAPTMSRTIVHKTRIFGQSHWINGVAEFMDILETVEPLLSADNSKVLFNLQKCKYLGKMIKSQRTPSWPTLSTTDLPPKDLADALVDVYLRAYECRYRVLHIPSFRQDYDALWGSDTPPDMEFIILLKLVMAIGAVVYDDNYSLRTQSIHWVYEAQTWIAEPDFKARLTLPFIQISILLLLAREAVWVNGALIWISVGELVRTAVYMGMHRDPSYLPHRSTFVSEMRRRLWNTILELALNTSVDSGAPPLLALEDFDTHPPGNFDDEDITAEDPSPKPDGTFTQMSISLALRKMFSTRLAVVKSLNGIGAHSSYEETIRLDTELRTAYRAVCRTLQGYSLGVSSPTEFQIRILDFLVRRYLLALHTPFYPPSLHETSYAFTRKVVVDTALQIWCAVNPSSDIMTTRHRDHPQSSEPDYLARLALCGSGPLRMITTQVCFLIAAELKRQLQEEDTIGPVPLRRDLLTVVENSCKWTWKCLQAGETNTKGYLFLSLVNAHLEGMMRGIPEEQFPLLYLRAAEDAQSKCLALFEEKVGQSEESIQMELAGINEMTFDSLPNLIGSWDFMIPEQFDLTTADSIYWPSGGFS